MPGTVEEVTWADAWDALHWFNSNSKEEGPDNPETLARLSSYLGINDFSSFGDKCADFIAGDSVGINPIILIMCGPDLMKMFLIGFFTGLRVGIVKYGD